MLRHLITLASISALPLAAVPEGFEIHEFAGPPEADYPAAITVAPNGDVYVSSDQNGSLDREKHRGRVIRCRDTNGDGKADEFVHFVPDVNSPRGGHMVGGTLYLVHPPYLSAFRDTDGDGIADEKKLLVSGLGKGIEGSRGADHTTNGVRMGIDGWLYVSVGDFGMSDAKGTDGKGFSLHGGGVVRVRPDGTALEPYALMTRNICDTAITPELDLFARDNTNDGKGWNTRFHHFTGLGDHGYPRLYQKFADEAIVPLADYGGGSGTGALWLEEPGFPGSFGKMLFSCDWTTGKVYYHPARRDGASFTIEQHVFEDVPRAIDIDVDGFSRLYIADWRNGGFTFAGPGKPVGMIHQVTVTAPGGTPANYQDPAKVADGDLIALLGSSSSVQRLEAQREVLRRGRKPAMAEALFAMAQDGGRPLSARVAAIFTFKQLYGPESTRYLAELVADETVREYALRAMADDRRQAEGVPLKPYLKALSDRDPRVILQALIGLERLGARDASRAVLEAAKGWREEGKSPRLALTAAAVLAEWADVSALIEGAGEAAMRRISLLALRQVHTTPAVNGLLGLIRDTGDTNLRFDALATLARLCYQEKPWDLDSWWGTQPDDRGPYFAPEEWAETPRIKSALGKAHGMLPQERQEEYLKMLADHRVPVGELDLAELDPVVAALEAVSPGKDELLTLLAAAKDSKRAFSLRLQCYRALAKGPEDFAMPGQLAVLAVWAAEKENSEGARTAEEDFVNDSRHGEQVQALRALGLKHGGEVNRLAWKAILTVLRSPLAAPEAKEEAQKLAHGAPPEAGFFQALAELGVGGFDAQIASGEAASDQAVATAARDARKVLAAKEAAKGQKVAELAEEAVSQLAMNEKGNALEGERLFTSQGCIACHSVDPKAAPKGPYLGSAGKKFTRDYLIESVLNPDKIVAQGFQTTLLTMRDGSSHLGFLTGEADGVIEIRDAAGHASKLRREEVVKEEALPQSMMPPGLADGLTTGEFTSLIDYLMSLDKEGG